MTTGIVIPGEVTEVVGGSSSGRTSLLLAAVAATTARGGVAALIDVEDALDIASAARAGVDLDRLLWVRCGGRVATALRAADLLVRCPGFTVIALDLGGRSCRVPVTAGFRLRLAARQRGIAVLLAARRRILGAAAAFAVEAAQHASEWRGAAAARLVALTSGVRVLRARGRPCREEDDDVPLRWIA
jgi:RecA/RadA recombinase